MPSANFNLGQILLADAGAKTAKTPGAPGGGADAFNAFLLGGLSQSGTIANSDILGKTPANGEQTIELLTLSPDLIETLQNLTPDGLQNLPTPLAAVFAPHMTEGGALDETARSLLNLLAGEFTGDAAAQAQLLENPQLARLLARFTAALKNVNEAAQAGAAQYAGMFDDLASQMLGTPTKVTGAKINQAGDGLVLITDKGNITVDVAELDLDQFNAFKKLAFADLAPFLTAPRTVRIDPHTLMKTAQGPSFLDDPNAPKVTYIKVVDLAGTIPQDVLAGMTPGASAQAVAMALAVQAQNQSDGAVPVFLDTALVARGAAAIAPPSGKNQSLVLPQSGQPVAADGTHPAAGRANFFAALLGLPPQPQTAQGDADAALAQAAAATQAPVGTDATAALARQIAAAVMPAVRAGTGTGQLTGLDTSLIKADADGGDLFAAGLDAAFPIRADSNAPAAAASTLLAAKTAHAGHPATHLVSITLQRHLEGGVAGADRQFTIQLAPEELGRVKVTLEFGENNALKAKLVAERPETVALLQKDAGALERTLHDAGFNVKADSLTFNLGGEGSFQGSMSQNGNSYQNGGNQPSGDDGTDLAEIHTVMPVFVDPVTGLTHVNIVV